ncbi:nucleolar protein 56 [Pieris rapae]|uniref:nucleolar protein 56 n=1 Tax=Pieris rapae TaxID=64459 RepID=UPI001E279EFF|nr:nucleolar protein 56 [Pieris rapae]
MSKLYILFEHAAGFALFRVAEFEELAAFLPQVEESVTDLQKFNSVVSLTGFQPFKSAVSALENINAVSEGILSEDLNLFLEGSLPKKKKRSKCTLGVLDPKLGAAISEALEIPCSHIGAVPELIRGIKFHFHALIKGLTLKACSVAQLGLGHSYSRARVKFNVHRVDNMIIQSIALLDQLDKDVNTFSMRIREWYSYHFPELVAIVPDNHLYTKCAEYIKDRKSLNEESLEPLTEILGDSEKAQAIIDASKMSMGMDISPVDLINIQMFAGRVVSLSTYRKQISEYLHTKMNSVAPNLTTLIGDQVGARLISKAGSLTNLAKYPASTLQILGAEKALFRALKTRSNTPKYGLLYHSTFIGRAGLKNKGRISRYLANKCSIASRIDCFSENQTTVFGEKLRQQVEDRLKFYETGDIPMKNIEVMKLAMEEAGQQELVEETPKKKKKKKKDKKQEVEAMEE